MKKAKARGFGCRTHAVVAITTTLCGLHSAVAANGGTIYFTGMIVAPPIEVSSVVVSPTPPARVTTQANASASTVAVTFKMPSGAVSGVDVSLQANDATAPLVGAAVLNMLAARFADGSGHVLAPARDGHYHVGNNGGTLLLGAKPKDQQPASKAVTVVLSYN
ncbi:hypothetical protein KNO81_39265 [Paraburkholderia sediminicola]|nr:hypothetical protein [Paraburkholderia sediminicola]